MCRSWRPSGATERLPPSCAARVARRNGTGPAFQRARPQTADPTRQPPGGRSYVPAPRVKPPPSSPSPARGHFFGLTPFVYPHTEHTPVQSSPLPPRYSPLPLPPPPPAPRSGRTNPRTVPSPAPIHVVGGRVRRILPRARVSLPREITQAGEGERAATPRRGRQVALAAVAAAAHGSRRSCGGARRREEGRGDRRRRRVREAAPRTPRWRRHQGS